MWGIRGGVLRSYEGRVMLFMADSESEITIALEYEGNKVFGGVVEPEEWLLARRNIPTCEGEECVLASLRSVGVCRILLRSGCWIWKRP